MCLHIYSLPSSAFLKYQTSGLYCTWSKSHPLLTFEHVLFAKFHFHHSVFPWNTWLGTDILLKNWSYIARSLVKKKSIPDWHLFITPNGKEMDQMVRNDIECNCIPIVSIAFGTHTFNFNCFFEDFYCLFTQIRSSYRVLLLTTLLFIPIPANNFLSWISHLLLMSAVLIQIHSIDYFWSRKRTLWIQRSSQIWVDIVCKRGLRR